VGDALAFLRPFVYNFVMSTIDILLRTLDPILECLTPDAARRIVELRAGPELQSRIDMLADRANEGVLTPEERAEYDQFIAAWHWITILQSKARQFLKSHPVA
jgi:hypothetical protein